MPRYSALREALQNTAPDGWQVVSSTRGGLHIWPNTATMRSLPSSVGILGEYACLFEVHVNSAGHARLLIRLRYCLPYRHHFNKLNQAAREIKCPEPRGGRPQKTGSVAMWQIAAGITFGRFSDGGNEVADLAQAIRQFLRNPPEKFTQMRECVVGYFRNDANWRQ
jgi:hypothetical protein